jgi:hypothetical protein
MEAQYSIPPLTLHDLLRESFTFILYIFIYDTLLSEHLKGRAHMGNLGVDGRIILTQYLRALFGFIWHGRALCEYDNERPGYLD